MQRSGFSEFLHQRRVAMGRSWGDILSKAYLSRATLHRIRHGDPHHPIAELDSLRALAHSMHFADWPAMVAAFDANDVRAGLDSSGEPGGPPQKEDAIVSLSKALNLSPTELVRRLAGGSGATAGASEGGSAGAAAAPPLKPGELPSAIRPGEIRPARFVPHFTSGVAASRPVEKLEDEDFESRQHVSSDDLRAFTIPVDGDCQEPVWMNGEIVLFSFDAYEREGILPGKSYYLAFTDGSTTFKRVFLDPADPEVYILRCWNNRKYPTQRRVHFSEVVRIARAVSKQVVPIEE
jgi:hypothetical protein